MSKNRDPKTLIEAVCHFSNLDVCHDYMVKLRWPDGEVCCPECGSINVGQIKSRRMFQCREKECRKQFSTKVGTIFEDSPLGLDKWFVAVWCIASARNGISSCELARALGITQKSAWHTLHRIRLAMETRSFRLISGEIEADASFIGGRISNMHRSKAKKFGGQRGMVGKAIVHGLLERGGQVRAKTIPDQRRGTVQQDVRANVEPGAAVYTDTLASYVGLDAEFLHKMVNHAVRYVEGRVHTNGLENFWSCLKRTISGTYVAIDPPHLDAYLDEQSWRYNNRKLKDCERFGRIMQTAIGRRLTYADLTERSAPA